MWATARIMRAMTHDGLFAEIERFLADTGMSDAYFGRLAVNDGKLMKRLRAGRAVETKTADKIIGFMRQERATRKRVLRSISQSSASEAA